MASINKVMILGNLGGDPEVRQTPGGQSVATFTVATNERWTDKAGQPQERTEWHRIVVWGKQAEHCGQYLKKGRQAFIEGRLQTREYTDKAGQKQYMREIIATNVTFIGGRSDGGGRDDFGAPPPTDMDAPMGGGSGSSQGINEDDIPF